MTSRFPAYPSPPALAGWLRQSSGSALVGVDFDGTWVELADQPSAVSCGAESQERLARLARRLEQAGHRLVLCSGRTLLDLQNFLPLSLQKRASTSPVHPSRFSVDKAAARRATKLHSNMQRGSEPSENAVYGEYRRCTLQVDRIGSHGLEWQIDGKAQSWVGEAWWRWRAQVEPELLQAVQRHGGFLEDKRVSLTLHYRGREAFWESPATRQWLESQVGESVGLLPGIKTWNWVGLGQTPGMQEPALMSKGLSLSQYAHFRGVSRVLYLGDEATDETVFAGGAGFESCPVTGVRVGYEGASQAPFRLASVADVHAWVDAYLNAP